MILFLFIKIYCFTLCKELISPNAYLYISTRSVTNLSGNVTRLTATPAILPRMCREVWVGTFGICRSHACAPIPMQANTLGTPRCTDRYIRRIQTSAPNDQCVPGKTGCSCRTTTRSVRLARQGCWCCACRSSSPLLHESNCRIPSKTHIPCKPLVAIIGTSAARGLARRVSRLSFSVISFIYPGSELHVLETCFPLLSPVNLNLMPRYYNATETALPMVIRGPSGAITGLPYPRWKETLSPRWHYCQQNSVQRAQPWTVQAH